MPKRDEKWLDEILTYYLYKLGANDDPPMRIPSCNELLEFNHMAGTLADNNCDEVFGEKDRMIDPDKIERCAEAVTIQVDLSEIIKDECHCKHRARPKDDSPWPSQRVLGYIG